MTLGLGKQQSLCERRGVRMRIELREEKQLLDLDPKLAQSGRDLADHRGDEPVLSVHTFVMSIFAMGLDTSN